MQRNPMEFMMIEWLWEAKIIKIVDGEGNSNMYQGTYIEIIKHLNELGAVGWTVAGNVSGGNWVLWTLQKTIYP